MSENNAHLNESRENRTERFQNGHPVEIIESILSSIQTNFNNEIAATFEDQNNRQTSLMFLGVHAAALTITHGIFGKENEKGYKKFVSTYMDMAGDPEDKKFSNIASEIHEWRNVIAHRWLNVAGHEIGYNFDMPEGWKKEDDVIYINPQIYLDHYLRAFDRREGGMIYRYPEILTTAEDLEKAKQRFLTKYIEEA